MRGLGIERFSLLFVALFCSLSSLTASANTKGKDIEANFRNVSDSQKIAVYWYWMAGNISKEGVVKDLRAMKNAGINRVQIGIIGEGQGTPTGPVKMFTDEWWDVLRTALKTAGDLNIEVGLFNCPGWSQSGGPWVKPNQAMRYVKCIKDTVSGPLKIVEKLPKVGPEEQRVKVLAYPLKMTPAKFFILEDVTKAKTINFTASKDVEVRSIIIYPVARACSAEAELFVKTTNGYKSIQKFSIDRGNSALNVGFEPFALVAISLPGTLGRQFRLVISKEGVIDKVILSDEPVVERYAEKTFAKMWPTPHPMWDAYMWRDQPSSHPSYVISKEDVKDISDKVDANGVLHWQVPRGCWVVMTTMMVPTGVKNAPAPSEATGYETDKMSKEHIRAHFDNYIGKILQRIPPEDRKTFKIVVEDSYETGGQNWTDNMIPDFEKAYGYSPISFLPVYSGVVVGSEEQSNRFLWDVRRLIADEVSFNYVGGLREVSNEHGLTTWLENYGHWGYPGEFLQYGSQSDEIAGEFWSFGDLGDIENRSASSCGHIYGKPKVWAESFTCGGPDFTQYPGQMKQRGDRFFTEGINSTLLHLYIEQPDEELPGKNAWFGNEFNRHNTWFSQLDVFVKYLKRCNYMLQQGHYVADVAYFLGEDAPKMTGIRTPEIPRGYSYDYVNADVLRDATIKDGKLLLKSGMEYSVLVLPRIETMRPELLWKIKELVAEGLVLLGPAPTHSPSLQNYPKADEEVKALAAELWQTEEKPYVPVVTFGKGRIYKDASLEQIFADLGVVPDCAADDSQTPMLFIHRQLPDGDYYFISNQSDRTIEFNASFRVKGMQPELWNPLEANVRLLPEFTSQTKTTEVPIKLLPFESSFIVFRSPFHDAVSKGENYPEKQFLVKVETPWTVAFQRGRGGPEKPVVFAKLADWTENSDNTVKYFSGTATYSNSFKLDKFPLGQIYIDLGKVMVMAKVKINGNYVGGVWTAPYRLDITSYVKKGKNTMEVEVVNCWRNRLIGEKILPPNECFTHQSVTYLKKDSELQPSGLLGPVEIDSYNYKRLP